MPPACVSTDEGVLVEIFGNSDGLFANGLVYLVFEMVSSDEEGMSLACVSTDKDILVGIFDILDGEFFYVG